MDCQPEKPVSRAEPPKPAPFRVAWLLMWAPISVACGGAMAWVAVVAGEYFAPLILFPLLIGAMTGVVVVTMVRLLQIGNRATIVAGTMVAALVAVIGQHYFTYRTTYRPGPAEVQTFQKAKSLLPAFPEYLQKTASLGRRIYGRNVGGATFAWLSWTLDGLLLVGASLALAIPAACQPYCNRCRSWYHAIRSGRLEPALGLELAESVGIELPGELASIRYRLGACNSGCGPSSFTLYWERRDGQESTRRVWLSAELRNRILELLDRHVAPSVGEGP